MHPAGKSVAPTQVDTYASTQRYGYTTPHAHPDPSVAEHYVVV
jgi:hypothetical protein